MSYLNVFENLYLKKSLNLYYKTKIREKNHLL